jgi:4-hydroxy-3-polyprenylbenzoate decarboxylase
MKYRDLREFMAGLERLGELKKIAEPVSARLEMTALSDMVLRAGGPALWFQKPDGYKFSALTNLFGTPRRVALGIGATEVN